MKIIKNILSIVLLLAIFSACQKDDPSYSLDNIQPPSKLEIMFDVAQDNTGIVTVLPAAEGVTAYEVWFGDVEGELPSKYTLGELISHTYSEGNYNVKVKAIGLTGLSTMGEQALTVSFKAPENLVVTVTPDQVNPRIVEVSATADMATLIHIYFGDVEDETPVSILPGEATQHTYAEPGDYELKVIAKNSGSATTEYTETLTILEASDPITLPIDFESFTVNYTFSDFGGVSSAVIDNPDASGINTSSKVGHSFKSAGSETWGGSLLTLGAPIDFSAGNLFKVKVWSPKSGAIVKLKVENLDSGDIAYEMDATTTTSNEWEELVYDFSGIDGTQSYQKIVIFFDFDNVGDDSDYYFDDIKLGSAAPSTGLVGTWKMAPEAGSLGVGPGQGDISWWAIDDAGVSDRGCFFDDEYVFSANGSFSNVLGADTWVEAWQGVEADGCGSPVAPHDGSAAATYNYDESAGTVTLNGIGAYLGIPKANNAGELTSPADAPESITYIIELQDGGNTMIIDIEAGAGVWWRYKLVKEGGGGEPSPIAGTWQMAPEAGSLGVGPGQGDISWWAIDDAGVSDRGCFFDDEYVFSANGSF
ncbi:PKD domain-containing protein, partial [Lentimicrobium sp. S6]